MRVMFAGISHLGTVRDHNEDVIFGPNWISTGSSDRPVVFEWDLTNGPVIAGVVDGMGGHAAGEIAAQILATQISQWAQQPISKALREINRQIYEEAELTPARNRMGATVAGVAVTWDSVQVFNVGDSRVYRQLGDSMMLLSTDDHSADGSGALTQSVGGASKWTDIAPHITFFEIHQPTRFLICSDGLTGSVPFAELEKLLQPPTPREAVTAMLRRTIESGANDNVSVCVLDIAPSEIRPATERAADDTPLTPESYGAARGRPCLPDTPRPMEAER